jgi:hypothetical protein
MPGVTQQTSVPIDSISEAIRLFKANIVAGKSWYIALLEAASNWTVPEEVIDGQVQHYLIDGEAFDFMALAERLLDAACKIIPKAEIMPFLFNYRPPVILSQDELKNILGESRFDHYLNYFYGVTAEEVLLVVTEEEVRKEERGLNMKGEQKITDEACLRIYGETELDLLDKFRHAKEYPQLDSLRLGEMKEFTYWRFKYRLSHSDPEKSASDTKKALDWLKKQQQVTNF